MSDYSIRDKYPAVVKDNKDPEHRGRLRLTARALVKEGELLPDWIPPAFPYAGKGHGWFYVPENGDVVIVEKVVARTDDAVPGMSRLASPDYRWLCGLYGADDLPAEFRDKYPKRMGIKSAGGMVLVFDDDAEHVAVLASRIRLGSDTSGEPLVLGNIFLTMMGNLLNALIVHTHGSAAGPTTPPLNVVSFTGLKVSPVDDRTVVSDKSFTEK